MRFDARDFASFDPIPIGERKIDPMTFAEELAKIGKYYNDATISTESNGPGYATIGRLVEIGYPLIWQNRLANRMDGRPLETIGWTSSMKTKEWAIGLLIKLIHDKDLRIHDRRTYDEMRNFVTLSSGGYGPADESHGHDDTVMALAIACICSATEGPLMAYSAADHRTPEELKHHIEPVWSEWNNDDKAVG